MKKLIFTFICFGFIYAQSNAQACASGSGPGVCQTNDELTAPGLYPGPTELAPVINGSSCKVVIQFENYDTLTFDGNHITVTTLQVASITNLPAGACWATNSPNNTYNTSQKGCIAVSFGDSATGVGDSICANPGQYQLNITVNANTNPLGTLSGLSSAAAGLYYFVRVINAGDAITPLDTAGESAGTLDTIIRYPIGSGPYESAVCSPQTCDSTVLASGIRSISSDISRMGVSPNPFNQSAVVTFTSEKNAVMTEKLTDMLGRTIYNKDVQVRMGANKSIIQRGTLPTGVYFYSIGNEKALSTLKVVITE